MKNYESMKNSTKTQQPSWFQNHFRHARKVYSFIGFCAVGIGSESAIPTENCKTDEKIRIYEKFHLDSTTIMVSEPLPTYSEGLSIHLLLRRRNRVGSGNSDRKLPNRWKNVNLRKILSGLIIHHGFGATSERSGMYVIHSDQNSASVGIPTAFQRQLFDVSIIFCIKYETNSSHTMIAEF